MGKRKVNTFLGIICLISLNSFGQQQINLANELKQDNIAAVNRIISKYGDHSGAIEMNAKKSDGLGILKATEFDKGMIEVELLGENNPGKSFIGIAFMKPSISAHSISLQKSKHEKIIWFNTFSTLNLLGRNLELKELEILKMKLQFPQILRIGSRPLFI